MTQEEIKTRTQEKSKEIQALCKKLHIIVTAEERITEEGFIHKMVFYTDMEKYPVDKEEKDIPSPYYNDGPIQEHV